MSNPRKRTFDQFDPFAQDEEDNTPSPREESAREIDYICYDDKKMHYHPIDLRIDDEDYLIAASCAKGYIQIMDRKTETIQRIFLNTHYIDNQGDYKENNYRINHITLLPDEDKNLAITANNNMIFIFNPKNGKCTNKFFSEEIISSTSALPDGTLAVIKKSGRTDIIDPNNGHTIKTFNLVDIPNGYSQKNLFAQNKDADVTAVEKISKNLNEMKIG